MVLAAPGQLFDRASEVSIRYEEQTAQPNMAPGEMIFWHLPGTGGESASGSGSTNTITASNVYRGQQISPGYVTPQGDVECTGVMFKLLRVGSPGIVTCELFAVDGDGFPTGSALATGTYDCDTITTAGAGEEVTFNFASSYNLTNRVVYAVYLSCAGADVSNYVRIINTTSENYAGGKSINSSDGGSSWSFGSYDRHFTAFFVGDYCMVNLFGTVKSVPLLDFGGS